MTVLANVALSDTFDVWRTRTNQLVVLIDTKADNSSLNVASNNAIYAFGQANIARGHANAAFLQANVANTIAVGNVLSNNMFQVRSSLRTRLNFIAGTNLTIFVNDDSAGDRANVTINVTDLDSAFAKANTAGTNALNAYDQSNTAIAGVAGGYNQANTARNHANAAFLQANNVTAAFNQANNVTAAFLQANTAGSTAISAFGQANNVTAAFNQANNVTAAFNKANAAYSSANNQNVMKNNATTLITTGYTVQSFNPIAAVSTYGTWTPDPANGNYQYANTNGALTIAAPTTNCAIDVLLINGPSAGAISFSGFTVGSSTGDDYVTTAVNKYLLSIRRIASISTYVWKALQ